MGFSTEAEYREFLHTVIRDSAFAHSLSGPHARASQTLSATKDQVCTSPFKEQHFIPEIYRVDEQQSGK